MKRKNRNPSASSTPPDGKKKKVAGNTEASTAATKAIDFSSPQRVLESLLSSTNLDNFFDEYWEKKPLFVSRENADFYGQMFTKKDLEAILKKEEIQFIEDMSLTRYAEGKTELLNEDGRVNMKHLKAAGVAVQFHQPDRYKVVILSKHVREFHASFVMKCVDCFSFNPKMSMSMYSTATIVS